ncbi:MAG: hypothetical protein HFI34_12490 [Lachnospiraceae bacterium]|nr:hypothetical protein [Lachnospiraceae bacterium]
MTDEKELTDLMTKTVEAYFRDDTAEGNRYAKELLHKLDFTELRDQNIMYQVLGHALVKHDELCVLDELKDAGFDFGMKLANGSTLAAFFSKYPKFNTDNRVYKKMEELGGDSVAGTIAAERLLKLMADNLTHYNLWWEKEQMFSDPQCRVASEELNEAVLANSGNITKESAELTDKMGLTVLHHLVWHNYPEAVEVLLKNGVNPDVRGGMGAAGQAAETYLDITPLHLACYMGNYKMAKLLTDYGADTTLCDKQGRNAYHYLACMFYENIKNNWTGQRESIKQRQEIFSLLQCDINARDNEGLSPLLQLLRNRNSLLSMNLMQKFIDQGADLNVVDSNGNTALMTAALYNQITAAVRLIKNKCELNLQNNEGDTALHISVREGDFEISYMLVDAGADCQIANNSGETAAEMIENGYREELKNRIGKKRSPAPKELIRIIETAFFQCGSSEKDNLEFALYLAEKLLREIDEDDDDELAYIIEILHGALREDEECRILDYIEKAGFTFDMEICYQRSIINIRDYCLKHSYESRVVKKLLDLGTDMNCAIIKGKTPANIVAGLGKRHTFFGGEDEEYYAESARFFDRESMEALDDEGIAAVHQAARNDHIEMMKVMLEKGVNINLTEDAPQEIGTTPLHIACIHGNTRMVKLLMDSGADDSLKTSSGETPAHFVVQMKQRYKELKPEVRAEMLQALSDIDTPRNDGKTPIILLQSMDYSIVCDLTLLLIERDVDLNRADNNGNTVLLAHTYNICNKDIVKELIRAGADVNAKNNAGDTALHYALRNGNSDVARFLIKKGADYNVANNRGEIPMEIAASKGYETVLALMIED